MHIEEMLNQHMKKFDYYSKRAESSYSDSNYATLAEAESRIIAALIGKL